MTYDVGNPGPGLGQADKCGGVKLINGVPTLHFPLIFAVLAKIYLQLYQIDQTSK